MGGNAKHASLRINQLVITPVQIPQESRDYLSSYNINYRKLKKHILKYLMYIQPIERILISTGTESVDFQY